MTALLVLSEAARSRAVYPAAARERLSQAVPLLGETGPAEALRGNRDLLARAEVILTSWGAPVMDAAFLDAAPNLKAVFYAGGTVRYFATEAFWQRGVRLFTAQAINAIPTSEYAVAAIVMALKRAFHFSRATRAGRTYPDDRFEMPGAYRKMVGLVSYGSVARLVRRRLADLEMDVLVYDPFLPKEVAAAEKVRLVGLDELFALSDVVSLHTALVPETEHMIGEAQLRRLKPGAAFLNTARGLLVDEAALVRVMADRPDVQCVLDVAAKEPPPPDSALYTLPNVFLTPHIAGSGGSECARLGEAMVDEAIRFATGQPLRWELLPEIAARTA